MNATEIRPIEQCRISGSRHLIPVLDLGTQSHFKEGIVRREAEDLACGGRMIFPFPEIEIV